MRAARKVDPRGVVAVVSAHCDGPSVHFITCDYLPPAQRMVEALRRVAGVWASGDGEHGHFPRCVFVQERPGAWVLA
jgi:hypothetical protein